MKIAYLCEHPTLLGGERSLLTFLSASRNAVQPVVVGPPSGALPEALDAAGIPRLPIAPADRLVELLRASRVELVHSNSLSMAFPAREVGRRLGVPVLSHVRDIYGLSQSRWRALGELAALLAVSPAVAEFLAAGGIEQSRIHTIVNAVSPRGELGSNADRRGVGLPEHGRLVACIGQFSRRKGQDVYLEAARLVAERTMDVTFLVIGERYSRKEESETYERRLRERGRELEASGRLVWLGLREDVRGLLSHVEVVVVPSRQEPLSRVALEALAAGCSIVATDVGGSRYLLDDGRLGRLVPPDDPASMAEAIMQALEEHPHRDRRTGPAWIAERFSPARQVAAILELYRRLLG